MTIIELQVIMDKAKNDVNLEYQRKLNRIREKVYEYNKEVGFYGIAGMEYEEFLESMKGYSFEERMKISFALLQHIANIDNIIFDEEGEE